jgi:hypothetical protein
MEAPKGTDIPPKERVALFAAVWGSDPAYFLAQHPWTIAEQRAAAHVAAMRAGRPGTTEYELAALIEYTFKRAGSTGPGYQSIVGAGANATILHYIRNDQTITDDTLPGGPRQVTRTFKAPFARANREEDYRLAWEFFSNSLAT